MAELLYGSGLRSMECLCLRVKDVDAVKHLHERDLASGHGEVSLPYALAQKYPNAAKE